MSAQVIHRYVAIGDSLTEGIWNWGQGERSFGFAYLVAQQLRKVNSELEFSNLGVGGARTINVIQAQLEPALIAQPDLLTVVVGANDVANSDPDRFRQEYTLLIERLRGGLGGLLVTATIPDVGNLLPPQYAAFRPVVEQRLHTFNHIIREVARAHAVLVVELANHPATADPANISADGFHPNPRGYRLMASLFITTLLSHNIAIAPLIDQ